MIGEVMEDKQESLKTKGKGLTISVIGCDIIDRLVRCQEAVDQIYCKITGVETDPIKSDSPTGIMGRLQDIADRCEALEKSAVATLEIL